MGYFSYILEGGNQSDREIAAKDERREEGRRRERQLEEWIQADINANRTDYAVSLRLWRDDVRLRLRTKDHPLPGIIKIPHCFTVPVKLHLQEVYMKEDFSVWEILNKGGDKGISIGRQLVPAFEKA